MKPLAFAYDVCRCYVRDNAATLGEEETARILGWIRSRNLARLASCTSLLPSALSSRERMRVLMQIEAFFKKNSVYSSPDCEAAALQSFSKSEEVCRITNRRLDWYCTKRDRLDPDLSQFLSRMERWITTTLGSHVTFLDELPRLVRVTAGATSSDSRRNSLPFMKINRRIPATARAKPYIDALATHFGYRMAKTVWTNWNRVETVPKNFKTERTIACEPAGLIPLQLAFDTYAKRRLRLRGIDLSQQVRNQRLAMESSLSGKYATIDLSAASDTVAFNTVAQLFPTDWFKYLAAVRTPVGKLPDGSYVKYAKFSSMGNGSTFTVETLIFSAACYAVGSNGFSVYGDDIIIETELVGSLLRLLRFLGFSINQDKSHISGPFRESCGVNAYEGVDITPFYIREVNKLKAIQSHNVNGLMSIAHLGGELMGFLVAYVKQQKLPLVPFNEDTLSGVFIDIHSAYRLRLLRTERSRPGKPWFQTPRYKAYRPKQPLRSIRDSRTLFLWYLMNVDRSVKKMFHFNMDASKSYLIHAIGTFKQGCDWDTQESSSVPMSSHRYVRKWVYWIPPVAVAPINLYGWSELLLHES